MSQIKLYKVALISSNQILRQESALPCIFYMFGQTCTSKQRKEDVASACKLFAIQPALLTNSRMNKLTHSIYWKSPFSILGMSGYMI